MKECKELARECDNIHLLGWLKQETVNDLMSETDIFCQLSPYENLWSSTLISAMLNICNQQNLLSTIN